MGRIRNGEAREVLFDHTGRPEAAHGGRGRLAAERGYRRTLREAVRRRKVRRFAWRVLAVFRRLRLERELDDEIAGHLELATAELIARGMSPKAARLAAMKHFGGVARTKQTHRDLRGFPWLDVVGRDVRYALRGMRRAPGFTAVAVATLALAIGANTAIFSVVNQLLIRPLAYRDADRLVVIDATRDYEGAPRPVRALFQLDAAQRWHDALHAFDDLTFYAPEAFQLSMRNGSEIVDGAHVAPSFFSVLGGPMIAGRPIAPAEALTPSIVISARLWHRLFNGSSEAIGARLTLNLQAYTVIGVAGPEWDIPSWNTDIWDSTAFAHVLNPLCCGVQLLGRLKPDGTIAQARADVRDWTRALGTIDARNFGGFHPTVTTLRNQQLGDGRTALLLLWAAVAVVLIVAC